MAEPFLGEIRLMSFDFPPQGWAVCDGSLLQIMQNSALYSLLLTTYGGNGTTTFALPDLRGRVPAHRGASLIEYGEAGGTEGEVITTPQMPVHTHQAIGTSTPPTSKKPVGKVWAATDATVTTYAAYTQGSTATMNAQTVANAGNGAVHSNMQPYRVINYCIALMGIYPSRP